MKRALSFALLAALVLVAAVALADEKKEMKAEKKPVTLKGEIVDTGCYIAHGAMGEKHKDCASKCIANGMPMALMASDGRLILLTLDHDNADPYNQCKTLAGAQVEVTGTMSERNGMKALDVTGVKAVAAAAATK
jgi:type 1 fimbria pilin